MCRDTYDFALDFAMPDLILASPHYPLQAPHPNTAQDPQKHGALGQLGQYLKHAYFMFERDRNIT